MVCPYPKKIPHPTRNEEIGKNKTTRDKFLVVPCGKCAACLTNRRVEWAIRLKEEFKYKSTLFLTLTYNEENTPYADAGLSSLYKADLVNFIKRLRKKTDRKVRYYAVGEYGSKTYRPHYHLFIAPFTTDDSVLIERAWSKYKGNDRLNKGIYEPIGHVKIGTLTDRSIMYVAKYHVNKTKFPEGLDPPFALMSKGIGKNYVKEFGSWHDIDRAFYQDKELKRRLPRYYKDKMYSKLDKAIMAKRSIQDADTKNLKMMREFQKKCGRNWFKYYQRVIERREQLFKEKSILNQTL